MRLDLENPIIKENLMIFISIIGIPIGLLGIGFLVGGMGKVISYITLIISLVLISIFPLYYGMALHQK